MIKVHCEGCGFAELTDTKKPKIRSVTLEQVKDPENSWTGTYKYEADLCPTCIGMLLHNYFGVDAEGNLEMPAFLEPRPLRMVEEGR